MAEFPVSGSRGRAWLWQDLVGLMLSRAQTTGRGGGRWSEGAWPLQIPSSCGGCCLAGLLVEGRCRHRGWQRPMQRPFR